MKAVREAQEGEATTRYVVEDVSGCDGCGGLGTLYTNQEQDRDYLDEHGYEWTAADGDEVRCDDECGWIGYVQADDDGAWVSWVDPEDQT